MAEADWPSRVVWLPRAIHHNEPESPNVVTMWRRALEDVPDSPIKDKAIAAITTYLRNRGPKWAAAWAPAKASSKPSGKALGKPLANQEQEQEKKTPAAPGGAESPGLLSASPLLGWDGYLASLSESDRRVLASVAEAISTTRKAGKVAPSVLDGLATNLAQYPAAVVTRAAQVYLDHGHAAEGKGERYLLGIVRGEAKQQGSAALRTPGAFQNGARPKTPRQLAIERALHAQAVEQGWS